MKFLVEDSMTRLAKKLRLLGFDAQICNRENFNELVAGRDVFLSKSKHLIERAIKTGIECYFLKSNSWKAQLKSVFQRYRLKIEAGAPFSRCSICNGELEKMNGVEIDSVPEYTALTHEEFFKCNHCGKIYWRGSHTAHMKTLLKIVELSDEP